MWKTIALSRDIGYTSVLKIMQIMRDKGILACDARKRPQVFRPRQSQQATLKHLAGDSLEAGLRRPARSLLLHALGNERTSRDELDEIRKLLDEMEGKAK